jgi:hypothetical protein
MSRELVGLIGAKGGADDDPNHLVGEAGDQQPSQLGVVQPLQVRLGQVINGVVEVEPVDVDGLAILVISYRGRAGGARRGV